MILEIVRLLSTESKVFFKVHVRQLSYYINFSFYFMEASQKEYILPKMVSFKEKRTKQVGLSRATLEFQVSKILSIVKVFKLDPSVFTRPLLT